MSKIFDNNFINFDDSFFLSDSDIENIHNSVNSDIITNKLLQKQLDELNQANALLKTQVNKSEQINVILNSQLDIANENLKKKDEIIFNQNIQIEQWKINFQKKKLEAKRTKLVALFSIGFSFVINFDEIIDFFNKIIKIFL